MSTRDPFKRAKAKTKVEAPIEAQATERRLPGGKCDCLNYCGDDTWVTDGSGRAQPCEQFILTQARKRIIAERARKVEALRHELLLAPMKNQYTFTRDELIELIGMPGS